MKGLPMTTPFADRQQGVMLLEALIGILIFSIGILALLGMQAVAMSTTIDAKYRSEASYLANEIIGVMWGDPANLSDYETANCAGTQRCAAWLARVQSLLPNAAGANVSTIAVNNRQVTVTVRWQPPGDGVSNHVVVAQIYRATD
jgi:type IV pilus assembly protein PilV